MVKQKYQPQVKHPRKTPEQRAAEYQRYRAKRKANAATFKKDLVSLAPRAAARGLPLAAFLSHHTSLLPGHHHHHHPRSTLMATTD